MNIEALFSSPERVRLNRYVIGRNGALRVNAVAKDLKISGALVSQYFNLLTRQGIMRKSGSSFFVLDNAMARAIKIFLNISSFDTRIFDKYDFVRSAGLYGSTVKGTSTENSDIDLWILVESGVGEEPLAAMAAELRKEHENVQLLVLTDKKIGELREKDRVFYYALIFGSVVIYGDGIEQA